MPLSARRLNQYHVFLASPGDVSVERRHVRQFFKRYNQQTANLWKVRFEVVDWENYPSAGVGRPQELITRQTLEKYRQSLVLVIGIMGQRFGSPTGKAESGTEEEFDWAMESHQQTGFPEIKWFFRKIDKLEMPTDPAQARQALEQWEKVLTFRQRMQDLDNPVFYTEYPDPTGFRDVLENDLNRWLADPARPWVSERAVATKAATTALSPPGKYYENIEGDFHRLDIAGIDNDRIFEIPLSEIYVRLRVMFDEDAPEESEAHESPDENTRKLLVKRTAQDENEYPRRAALRALAVKWPDENTRKLLAQRAVQDENEYPRCAALEVLAEKWPSENTRKLLVQRAVQDENEYPRCAALEVLAEKWPSENTRKLLAQRAVQDHCAAWILGRLHSEFGRIVFSKDGDGFGPFLNPRMAISLKHIEKAARRANVRTDKIDETVQSLSEHLGWDITQGLPE